MVVFVTDQFEKSFLYDRQYRTSELQITIILVQEFLAHLFIKKVILFGINKVKTTFPNLFIIIKNQNHVFIERNYPLDPFHILVKVIVSADNLFTSKLIHC